MIPIVSSIIRFLWVVIEVPYVRRYRIATTQNADRGSARVWDLANAIELVGMFLGFAGIGPMHVHSQLISLIGLGLLVAGIIIRWSAIHTLGKYFTFTVLIKEDHQLIRNGLYKLVRHPSYTGALVAHLGLGLSFANWFSLLLSSVPFMVAAGYRMHVEEIALGKVFGEDYLKYSEHTKRLIPGIY